MNFQKMHLTPVVWGLGWIAILLPNLYSYLIPRAYLKYFWQANWDPESYFIGGIQI